VRGARVLPEIGTRLACHAMVRRREPLGQGEWAGAGRLVRPAHVSTFRSRVMWRRAHCAPCPLQECATGSHGGRLVRPAPVSTVKGPGEVGPGALCARPPSRNHMTQKNAKEAGWEVPSRKTKHWDGSLAQHMLTTSHKMGRVHFNPSALQLAVAWRTTRWYPPAKLTDRRSRRSAT